MPNKQLSRYIQEQRQQGFSDEDIQEALKAAGWQDSQIAEAFAKSKPKAEYKKPKKRFYKRWWFFIPAGLVGLIIVLFLVWLATPWVQRLIYSDSEPGDYSDLMYQDEEGNDLGEYNYPAELPSVPDISEQDNAFYDLIKLNNLTEDDLYPYENMIWTPDDDSNSTWYITAYILGEDWDEDIVNKLLEHNQEPLQIFDDALSKEAYQLPFYSDHPIYSHKAIYVLNNSLAYNSWRDLGKLKALQAVKAHRDGNTEEAIEIVFDILELGQKWQNSVQPDIGFLASKAFKGYGLKALRTIVRDSDLSSDKLKGITEELEKYYPSKTAFKNFLRLEFWRIVNEMDLAYEGDLDDGDLPYPAMAYQVVASLDLDPGVYWDVIEIFTALERLRDQDRLYTNPYYFQPNTTKIKLAEYFKDLIKAVDGEYSEYDAINEKKYNEYNDQDRPVSVKQNLVGDYFYSIRASTTGLRKATVPLEVTATQTVLAMLAYQKNHEKIPESLEDLTPEYLPSVPIDPYSGEPLVYLPDYMLVHSVSDSLDFEYDPDYKNHRYYKPENDSNRQWIYRFDKISWPEPNTLSVRDSIRVPDSFRDAGGTIEARSYLLADDFITNELESFFENNPEKQELTEEESRQLSHQLSELLREGDQQAVDWLYETDDRAIYYSENLGVGFSYTGTDQADQITEDGNMIKGPNFEIQVLAKDIKHDLDEAVKILAFGDMSSETCKYHYEQHWYRHIKENTVYKTFYKPSQGCESDYMTKEGVYYYDEFITDKFLWLRIDGYDFSGRLNVDDLKKYDFFVYPGTVRLFK